MANVQHSILTISLAHALLGNIIRRPYHYILSSNVGLLLLLLTTAADINGIHGVTSRTNQALF
jgi:hypothetical protein